METLHKISLNDLWVLKGGGSNADQIKRNSVEIHTSE